MTIPSEQYTLATLYKQVFWLGILVFFFGFAVLFLAGVVSGILTMILGILISCLAGIYDFMRVYVGLSEATGNIYCTKLDAIEKQLKIMQENDNND